jgi:hypothetical protein
VPLMERMIQRIKKGKWEEAIEFEKRFDALEARQGGIPAKRRYRCVYGAYDFDVFIWEREWEDLATLQQKYMEQDNPDLQPLWQELFDETEDIYESNRRELYWVVQVSD